MNLLLADITLKATLLLAAAGVLAATLRRASAATRHLVWLLAVAALAVLPALAMMLPAWRVAVVPPAAVHLAARHGLPGAHTPSPGTPGEGGGEGPSRLDVERRTLNVGRSESANVQRPTLNAQRPTADGLHPDLLPAHREREKRPADVNDPAMTSPGLRPLPALWLAGVLVALAHVLVGLLAAARVARSATPTADAAWLRLLRDAAGDLGLARPVRLLLAPRRGNGRPVMPMTFGVFRPVLLLPAEAHDWPADRRRVVVLHELAHVRRLDCLTQLLAQVACAVHWFNPLAWLAARLLRAERERACDDLVLLAGSPPADYAGHLLTIARTAWACRPAGAAAVAMARRSQLEGRLRAVLDRTRRRAGPGPAIQWTAAVLAAAVILPLATVRLGRAADAAGQASAAAPATRPVGRDAGPFVASLPNGGSVELLAVSPHPSRGESWWSPAGNRLAAGFVTKFEQQQAETGKTQAAEFVVRVSDLPAGSSVWPRWQTPGVDLVYAGGEARPAGSGDKMDPRYRAMAAVLPADLTRVNLRVGVATAPWRTLAEALAAEGGSRTVADGPTAEAVRKRVKELEGQLGLVNGFRVAEAWVSPPPPRIERLTRDRDLAAEKWASLRSRYSAVVKDAEAGHTPSEVERHVWSDPRFVTCQQRLDDLDIELDQLTKKLGPNHDWVIQWKKRRAAYQEKLDEARRELTARYTAEVRSTLASETAAAQTNLDKLEAAVAAENDRNEALAKADKEYQAIRDAVGFAGTGVSFAKAVESDGNVVVSVAHAVTGADVRVVGVDPAGREIVPGSLGTNDVNGVAQTTATFHHTPLAALKTVRLQSRPFDWVEFPGVRLTPAADAGAAGRRDGDQTLLDLARRRDDLQGRIAELRAKGYAENHKEVVSQRAELEDVQAAIARRLEELRQAASPATRPAAAAGGPHPADALPLAEREKELARLVAALHDAEDALAATEQAVRVADKNGLPPAEDWARADPAMAAMVEGRSELSRKLAALANQLGPDHAAVVKAKKDLNARTEEIANRATDLSRRFVLRWKADGNGPVLVPRDTAGVRETVDRLRSRADSEAAAVKALRDRVDVDAMLRARVEQLIVLQQTMHNSEEMLTEAEQELATQAVRPQKYDLEDWARVDEAMAKQLQARNELELRIDSLVTQVGQHHPAVVAAKQELAARERALQAAADKLAAQFFIRWKPDGTGGILMPRDLTKFRESVAREKSAYERQLKTLNDLRADLQAGRRPDGP